MKFRAQLYRGSPSSRLVRRESVRGSRMGRLRCGLGMYRGWLLSRVFQMDLIVSGGRAFLPIGNGYWRRFVRGFGHLGSPGQGSCQSAGDSQVFQIATIQIFN